jgi:hypothetical protein
MLGGVVKQFGDEILDSLAPELAQFTSALIPQVEADFPERGRWMSNYFRYTMLSGTSYTDKAKPHYVTFLLRAQSLFRSYSRAKRATEEFLACVTPNNPPIDKYFAALNEWEHTVLDWGIAVESFNAFELGVAFDKKLEKDKFEYATYMLYTTIKHWSSTFTQHHQSGDTVPMWLVMDGLASRTATTVPFGELARLVRDVGSVADEIQNPGAHQKRLNEGAPTLPKFPDSMGEFSSV